MSSPQVKKFLVIGRPGSGKSTFARVKIADSIAGYSDHLVIEPDDMGDAWQPFGYQLVGSDAASLRKSGKKRIVYNEDDSDLLVRIKDNVFNQVIIFDDALFMLDSPNSYRKIKKVFGRARQTGNYIIFTIHSMSDIPAGFWQFFTDLILFKTMDNADRAAYKIPGFHILEQMIEIVNAHPDEHAHTYIKRL